LEESIGLGMEPSNGICVRRFLQYVEIDQIAFEIFNVAESGTDAKCL
jgi:hypothetical protein